MTFPPGQVPTRITPIASSGERRNTLVRRKAKNGIRVNCATAPIMTSLGLLKTSVKSDGFRVSPIPNMTMPSKVLIHAVLIKDTLDGKKREMAATRITISAIHLLTKSLNFSNTLIQSSSRTSPLFCIVLFQIALPLFPICTGYKENKKDFSLYMRKSIKKNLFYNVCYFIAAFSLSQENAAILLYRFGIGAI